MADETAVRLELGLARAAHADAAAELLEVGPHARQPRQRVLELRELHLHLGLGAARAHGEDVEDQLGAVDDALADLALEVLALRRREFIVEDDDRRLVLGDERLQLLDLAAPDVGRGVGTVDLLGERRDDDGARGVRELRQLVEVLDGVMARVGPLDGRADEDGAFLRGLELDEFADGASAVEVSLTPAAGECRLPESSLRHRRQACFSSRSPAPSRAWSSAGPRPSTAA